MEVGNAFTSMLVVRKGSVRSVSCTHVLKTANRNIGYV
jgi:hypothetical protein